MENFRHVALIVGIGVVAGWLIGTAALFIAVELTDGKAIDIAWISS